MKEPRILFWDIETSYDILAKFGLREEYTHPDNIIQDWFIISAAWKWRGNPKVHSVHIKKPTDDKKIVQELYDVLKTADCIIGHNGDKFDLKKFKTRAAFYGLDPLPVIRTRDTLKIAKKHFAFTSNRMDYIAKYLGLEGKQNIEKGLWKKALFGDMKAIRTIAEYNKKDVMVLEAVFNKLEPHDEAAINQALYHGIDGCPYCASENYQSRGYAYNKSSKFRRFHCQDCDGRFQDGHVARRARLR